MTGDTMALARARASCTGGSTSCSEIPRVNLRDMDVWTNPTPVFTVDLAMAAAAMASAPACRRWRRPASAASSPGTSNCRIVINYEQHIHPLWSVDRGSLRPE